MKKSEFEAPLRKKLERLEGSGKLYEALVSPWEAPYLRVSLKLPDGLTDTWAAMLSWNDFWKKPLKDTDGHPLWKAEERKKTTVGFGRQSLCYRVTFETPEDVFAYLSLKPKKKEFLEILGDIENKLPELRDWCIKYFLRIHEEGFYPKCMAIGLFMKNQEQKEGYLREMAIPGVDTKFLENHSFLVRTLWNALFPENPAENTEALMEKLFISSVPVASIGVRSLDRAMTFCGVSKLFLSQDEIGAFRPPHRRVFITENKVNGFTFPEAEDSLILFGMGYGVLEMAKAATWLSDKEIYYWGDLDSDGFQILSDLRGLFPPGHVHSFLMDRTTLSSFVDKEIKDTGNTHHIPENLTVTEKMAWQLVSENGWRLEQERIPRDEVEWAVGEIVDKG